MLVKPDYFSWSEKEQEAYGIDLPEDDDFRIRQSIVKSLFGIEADSNAALDKAFDRFTDKHYLRFNDAMLPLIGIGENDFFFNEGFGEKKLLDFETLHDYAFHDHQFQEDARQRDFKGYEPKPYRGNLSSHWARIHVDGAFYYVTLFCAASYLHYHIDERGHDLIRELIPYHHVDGKEHGKPTKGGTILNFETDAGGLEPQLDELKHRFYRYLQERYDAIGEKQDADALGKVYIMDVSTKTEPQLHIVFSDQSALKAVRFRSFMQDCQHIAGNEKDLRALEKQEETLLRQFLEEQHRDIMENFNPNVVPLRKKYKLIASNQALEDIGRIASDEDHAE